jgi:hypothetical protein
MPDKSWKAFERRIAKAVGGKRRGADYRNRESSGGLDDIVHPELSIECKLLGRPAYGDLLNACKQAERNCPDGKVPLALVKKKNGLDEDALVIMRFGKFVSYAEEAEQQD